MDQSLKLSILAGNHSKSLKRIIDAKVDEEQATINLAAVVRPERLEPLVDEARRRAEVMQRSHIETPHALTTTPLVAGLRSVLRDVSEGFLS